MLKGFIKASVACCLAAFLVFTSVFSSSENRNFGLDKLSVYAQATVDGFEYAVNDDDTVTITKYFGSEINLKIPSQIYGKNVNKIEEEAFRGCEALESIEIPEGVKKIGNRAFIDCKALKNVTINEKRLSIDSWAFDLAYYDAMTIYGISGSDAEKYAKEKNIKFVAINKSGNLKLYGAGAVLLVAALLFIKNKKPRKNNNKATEIEKSGLEENKEPRSYKVARFEEDRSESFSNARVEIIKDMGKKGYSVEVIAKEFNCTAKEIEEILKGGRI